MQEAQETRKEIADDLINGDKEDEEKPKEEEQLDQVKEEENSDADELEEDDFKDTEKPSNEDTLEEQDGGIVGWIKEKFDPNWNN